MSAPFRRPALVTVALAAGALALWSGVFEAAPAQQDALTASGVRLAPTAHPPVPAETGAMWLAPAQAGPGVQPAIARLARGVELLEEDGDAKRALPLVSDGALAGTPVADYARYYTGLAYQALERYDEAEAAFAAVAAREVAGHLPEDALFHQAEVRDARGDAAGAMTIYRALLQRKIAAPHVAWLRLGAAAEAASQVPQAIEAYRRVYYDYPLSSEAGEAERALIRLKAVTPDSPALASSELTRADLLYSRGRWRDARSAYDRLEAGATGAEKRYAAIRKAACDVKLGHGRQARTVLAGYLDDGPYAAEARLHLLLATRAIGRADEYVAGTHAFVRKYAGTALAAYALDELGTHHIIADEDQEAADVFERIVREYPDGEFAERAAWKAGWWAYRHDRYADAIRFFEQGSATFPRSDYRPAWLYWIAKSYDQLGDRQAAVARYGLTVTDYRNIYYGRLAAERLAALKAPAVPASVDRTGTAAEPPPTTGIITTLIGAGLYGEALNELRYAERMWGGSPRLTATIALVNNRMGRLRVGINAMKRAYPQYMAAGGEALPDEILHVLFPLDYWNIIQKVSKTRGLDPYLVAALIGQESTFDPVIRSSANAIGLMQLLPSTGRIYGRKIGIRRYSTRRLTEPEVNILIGTAYFRDLMREFGRADFALASYNAGENRVRRWRQERPGLPQDEFIDDIPFPETQNYVKRILGTAYDYKRLYGN
ncbi:MAG: transglycosylase SLT domain-containing protein [Vicinamibacterales bacterium]